MAANSTANTPVRNMPSIIPAPPMERTIDGVLDVGGANAGSTPGVKRLNMSAPRRVPMDPLMYAKAGADCNLVAKVNPHMAANVGDT